MNSITSPQSCHASFCWKASAGAAFELLGTYVHKSHILDAHLWRAAYAQPVVERGYRQLIPQFKTPIKNLFIATMAQIYPEDRGTNYAIRQGRDAAAALQNILHRST